MGAILRARPAGTGRFFLISCYSHLDDDHGTQDLYPHFLRGSRFIADGFLRRDSVANVAAVVGRCTFWYFSEHFEVQDHAVQLALAMLSIPHGHFRQVPYCSRSGPF